MTITEFLSARIAEDEYWADEAGFDGLAARILAECKAKRAIIEREVRSRTKMTYRRKLVLQDLATVYADHPDYQPEWAPP